VLKSYSDVLCNSEFVGISADIDSLIRILVLN